MGGCLIWAGCAAATEFDTAYRAYQAGDYETAARDFKRLAQAGNAQAQYLLGLLYLNGQGVGMAPQRAIDWLTRSAENGYYLAAVELGQIYSSGRGVAPDPAEAAKWISLSSRLATDADADQECE